MIRLSGLLGVLILCSGVYFFWQRWGQRLFDDSWRAVVTRPAPPASKPKPRAAPVAPPTTAAQAPSSAATPLTPEETAAQQPAGQAEAKVDVPPPGVTPKGKIEIHATGFCWVGGWRDGAQFLSSTLHPGEVRVIEGGGALRLQFGSSGDVAVTVDGNALPTMGAKGERRALEYRDGSYHLLNRERPAEAKP